MPELSLLLKATTVLTLALAAVHLLRRSRASVRALLLVSTFGVLLVLPVAAVVIPPRTIVIPVASSNSLLLLDDVVMPGQESDIAPTISDVRSDRMPFAFPPLALTLRVIWALGAILCSGAVGIALLRLRRMRRHATPWLDGHGLLETVARQAGVTRHVTLFLHPDLPAPMTCGLFRPAIGLPMDATHWPEADVRHALVHEIEHVRRGDWITHLLARLVCALYWFHPMIWPAWRKLALESERACDDAVLHGSEGAEYALQLLLLARRIKRQSSVPMLSMAGRSNLALRVAAVLDSRMARGRAGAVATITIVVLTMALAVAISPLQAVGRFAARASDIAQASAGTPLAFEVASIKRNMAVTANQTILLSGNTFIAQNVTLRDLIAEAYRIRSDRHLSGVNGWMTSERYDIEAKPERAATWDEHVLMLQALLTERFKLRVRRETRDTPVYALVGKGGGRMLKPAADGDCVPPPRGSCGGFRTTPGDIVGRRVTVSQLAAILSGPRTGRQVVDSTAIEGFFDVELRWTPDAGQLPPGPAPDDVPPVDPSGPSLFTAIQEQLGLRLQPSTAALEHLVIDSAERPSPNDASAAQNSHVQPAADDAGAFEVASIKRSTSSDPARGRIEPGGRFTAVNTPPLQLVSQAYDLLPSQILNAPDWIRSERYDILAKAPDGVPLNGQWLAPFLRGLLNDRFAFRAHIETREVPIYELVLSRRDRKPGPRLERAAVDCTTPTASRQADRSPEDKPACAVFGFGGRYYQMRGYPLSRFAQILASPTGRPVVDRTGLAGAWNLQLDFTPDSPADALRDAPAISALQEQFGVTFDLNAPSLFTALQEQLGLKLEPARGTVNVLVIDRMERPTEN